MSSDGDWDKSQHTVASNDTIHEDHVVDEFGDVQSGLLPVDESDHRIDFRYVNDARNHLRGLTVLHLPDYFENGDDAARFVSRSFSYAWPHLRGGEEAGDEWTQETTAPSLTARLSLEGIVTEWEDGSSCRYEGLSWRDAGRCRFARTIARRFTYDDLAYKAEDYAADVRKNTDRSHVGVA